MAAVYSSEDWGVHTYLLISWIVYARSLENKNLRRHAVQVSSPANRRQTQAVAITCQLVQLPRVGHSQCCDIAIHTLLWQAKQQDHIFSDVVLLGVHFESVPGPQRFPRGAGGTQKGCFGETKFNHCESVSGPRRFPRGASRPAQAAQPAGSSDAAAAAAVSAASDTLFLCAARRLGGVRGGDVGNLEPARARARLSTAHCKPNHARRLELSGRAQLAPGSARRRHAVFCSSMLFSIPACGC